MRAISDTERHEIAESLRQAANIGGAKTREYGVPNYCHNCGVAIHNGC